MRPRKRTDTAEKNKAEALIYSLFWNFNMKEGDGKEGEWKEVREEKRRKEEGRKGERGRKEIIKAQEKKKT